MDAAAHHETFVHHTKAKTGSDRQFGLAFGVFFLAMAVWPLRHGGSLRVWAIACAIVLFGLAWLRPSMLHQPNRLWAAFGILLGKITTPLVTGILFFVIFTPAAFLMRLARKDPLRLRAEPASTTYWIKRTPGGQTSMMNQF
jgi:hypothetical protein